MGSLRKPAQGLREEFRSLMTESAYLGASSLIGVTLRIVYLIIIARYLGPEKYGMYAYGQALYIAMLPLAMLGMGGVLLREIARRGREGTAFIDASLMLSVYSIGATAIINLVIGIWGAPAQSVGALIGVFTVALIGRSLSQWVSFVFIATGKAYAIFSQERIFRPLEVLFGVALLVNGFGVISIVILHAVTWWIQAIQGFRWLNIHGIQPKLRYKKSSVYRLIRSGLPLGLATGLAGWTVTGPLIIYSKNPGIEPTLLGQAAILIQTISILFSVVSSMAGAAVPVLSKGVHKNGEAERTFLLYAILLSCMFWGVFGLCIHIGGLWVTGLTLGSEFSAISAWLGPAVLCLVPLTVARACHVILVSRNVSFSICLPSLWGTIGASTYMILFQEKYGFGSAVFSVAIGAFAMAIAGLWMVFSGNQKKTVCRQR